jgi:hypothetical protein
MPDCGSQEQLTLHRLEEGGFLVTSAYFISRDSVKMLFGSTTIDEALDYIRSQMTPIVQAQAGKG